jgi:hypothetical protein
MEEDLTKMWKSFSLTEEEDEEMEVIVGAMKDTVARSTICLVGKLISNRLVNKDTIRAKLKRGWRPTGELMFKVVGDNLSLLEFEHSWDKDRVLEGRPWIFEGSLFSVEAFDGLTTPLEVDFEKAAFWVRMINLPLAYMNKMVGEQIGSSLGKVEEVDTCWVIDRLHILNP